jgi:phage-related protein
MKRLPAAFYQLPSGREPVREWLKALEEEDRKVVGEGHQGRRIFLADRHAALRSLGKGLWEVRSDLAGGRIARVIFCIVRSQMVLLHGFVKKTQKTPASDLGLALRRKKEIA